MTFFYFGKKVKAHGSACKGDNGVRLLRQDLRRKVSCSAAPEPFCHREKKKAELKMLFWRIHTHTKKHISRELMWANCRYSRIREDWSMLPSLFFYRSGRNEGEVGYFESGHQYNGTYNSDMKSLEVCPLLTLKAREGSWTRSSGTENQQVSNDTVVYRCAPKFSLPISAAKG